MNRLIRLYPKAWRERYADELAVLLEDRPPGPAEMLDLVVGAFDAHLRRGAGRRRSERKGISMSIRSIHPALLLLMAIAGLLSGYALIVSVIAALEPDPERWQGWGPIGLAAAAGLMLGGLALAFWRPTIGAALGLCGAVLAIAAAPWMWFVAILVGVAPTIPFLARRSRPPSATA